MKNRLFFTILFLTAFVLLGSWYIQHSLTWRLDQIRTNKALIEARNVIYTDSVNCLKSCQARLFQAPLTSINATMFQHYIETIKNRFGRISRSFEILKNGGEYLRVVPLNLPDKSEFKDRYLLKKGMEIPPQLALNPQLGLLKQKINQIEGIIGELFRKVPEGVSQLSVTMRFRYQLATLVKELDAIFRRLYENINELLYINRTDMSKIEKERDEILVKLKSIKIITVLITIVLILLMGILAYRNLKKMNRRLADRLYIDELTGLRTRYALEERGISSSETFMLLDILNFNEINDLYGMKTGDEVLKKLAELLKEEVSSERLYHIGGDTFGVLMEPEEGETDCRKTAEEIIRKIENFSYEVCNVFFRLRVCAGASTGSNALHEAMIALDESKQKRRSFTCYNVRERNFLQKIQNTRMMQKLMLEALERDRIVPFFQPIVDRNGQVVSWEALMRISLQGENVLPDFEAAIQGRIYPRLSRRMIERAFGYIDRFQPLSINLGYEDVQNEEIVEYLEEKVRESGRGELLTFELLESSAIDNYQIIEEFVHRFKSYGVRIAIDDFGSDYSNLLRTLRLSPDYLKIDGTLIQHVVNDPLAEAAVKSIVVYAHNLGILTVAEYVSDEEIAQKCRELGIDLFQGFYFCEPLDPRKEPNPPDRYTFSDEEENVDTVYK